MKVKCLIPILSFNVSCATVDRVLTPDHYVVSFETKDGSGDLNQYTNVSGCSKHEGWYGDSKEKLLSLGWKKVMPSFVEENEIFPLHDNDFYLQSEYRYTSSSGYSNHQRHYQPRWGEVAHKKTGSKTLYRVFFSKHWSHNRGEDYCHRVASFLKDYESASKIASNKPTKIYRCTELQEEVGLRSTKTDILHKETVQKFAKEDFISKFEVENVYKKNGRLYLKLDCTKSVALEPTISFDVKVPKNLVDKYRHLEKADEIVVGLTNVREVKKGFFKAKLSKDLTLAGKKIANINYKLQSRLYEPLGRYYR